METLNDSTIKNFAAAVRADLKDLPKSTIDDLTFELEGSLSERFGDEGEEFSLGSPKQFAAELRESAGLPPKAVKANPFSSGLFLSSIEAWFRKNPATEALIEFAIAIRPLWWICRAVIVWAFIFQFNLNTGTSILVLSILSLLSIQWGRKKWFTNKFFAAILLPLNLIGILLVPASVLVFTQTVGNLYNAESMLSAWPATDGLRLNGNVVAKIHAYDANGKEILDLTYQDQEGNEIDTTVNESTQWVLPDIVGLTFDEADRKLKDAGIPAIDYVFQDKANEQNGVILRVIPSTPGTLVGDNDHVVLVIGAK